MTRAEAMASDECQRATDEFNALVGAAELCDARAPLCLLTYKDLVEIGNAYYRADAICGAGTLADAPQ